MKIILLLMIVSHAAAALPTLEEDIAALKAERAKRIEIATRAADDWYSLELAKKEKAASGKDGGAYAKERMISLICSVPEWTWDAGKAGQYFISLRVDGTGRHSHANEPMTWTLANGVATLLLPDGRKAVLRFDTGKLCYAGVDFDGKNKVVGRPKP